MSWRKSQVVVIFGIAAFSGPFGGDMVLPLFRYIGNDFSVGQFYLGLTITLYMIPFSILQLFSGMLSDVFYGRRKTLLFGATIYSLGALSSYFSPSIAIFLLSRVLQGVGSAFITPISMALVGDVFEAEVRGRVMGFGALLTTLGATLGPLVGGFMGLIYWRYVFLVMLLFGLILFILIYFFLPEQNLTHFDRKEAFGILKYGIFNFLVILIGFMGLTLFFTRLSIYTFLSNIVLYPPYNLPSNVWGTYLFTAGLGGVIASIISGFLTDFIGRRKVVLIGFLSLDFLTSLYLFINWFTYLPILLFAMGFIATLSFTPLNTLAVEIDPKLRGTISSIYGSFRFVGYALGPVAPYPIFVLYGLNGVVIVDILLVSLSFLLFLCFFKEHFNEQTWVP